MGCDVLQFSVFHTRKIGRLRAGSWRILTVSPPRQTFPLSWGSKERIQVPAMVSAWAHLPPRSCSPKASHCDQSSPWPAGKQSGGCQVRAGRGMGRRKPEPLPLTDSQAGWEPHCCWFAACQKWGPASCPLRSWDCCTHLWHQDSSSRDQPGEA